MSKINVNIRLEQQLKESASLLAEQMWTNLSNIINMFLVQFTRTRKIEIWLENTTEFKNFDVDEIKNIEWLSNFTSFMNSIKWK